METIENYEFKHVYRESMKPEDAKKFATVFGEGSKALTSIIEYCITNGIPTLASCKGHPEDKNIVDRIVEDGYVTFKFNMNYDDSDFAYYLASIPMKKDGITAHLESNFDNDRTLTLYVPARRKDMSESYFEFIFDSIKEYKRMKEEGISPEIDPDIRTIVDYEFYSWNNESFDITRSSYKKYARNGMYLKKIAKCPSSTKVKRMHALLGKSISSEDRVNDFVEATRNKRKY